MNELNTPFKVSPPYKGDCNTNLADLIDCNGFYFGTLFQTDAKKVADIINSVGEIKQQLAESQASNERLREFVAGVSNASTYASDYTGDVEYIDKDYKEDAMDLLRETPKQSLDHIKAEAGYKKYGEEVSEEQIAKVLADQWYFTTESKDKLVRPLMKHFHVFQREE